MSYFSQQVEGIGNWIQVRLFSPMEQQPQQISVREENNLEIWQIKVWVTI